MVRCQFFQGTTVDFAFKRHDAIQWMPVTDPAPVIKLRRLVTVIKTNAGFIADHLQEEPLLFLANAERILVATNQSGRQPVTEPATGTAQNADIVRNQANFFMQFTK